MTFNKENLIELFDKVKYSVDLSGKSYSYSDLIFFDKSVVYTHNNYSFSYVKFRSGLTFAVEYKLFELAVKNITDTHVQLDIEKNDTTSFLTIVSDNISTKLPIKEEADIHEVLTLKLIDDNELKVYDNDLLKYLKQAYHISRSADSYSEYLFLYNNHLFLMDATLFKKVPINSELPDINFQNKVVAMIVKHLEADYYLFRNNFLYLKKGDELYVYIAPESPENNRFAKHIDRLVSDRKLLTEPISSSNTMSKEMYEAIKKAATMLAKSKSVEIELCFYSKYFKVDYSNKYFKGEIIVETGQEFITISKKVNYRNILEILKPNTLFTMNDNGFRVDGENGEIYFIMEYK